MAEKDFVVKNGLVVNTNLIVADGDLNRVGINNSAPDASLTVTGTANVSGNAVFGANLTAVGNLRSAQLLIGDNVAITNTNLFVGNSTVNSVQTSSLLSVSNSTSVANLSALDLKIGISTVNSSTVSVGSNVSISSSELRLGNSTVNVAVNSSTIAISNSIATITVNTSIFTGTANNTSFVGSVSAANVVSNAQLSANLAAYQTSAGLSANVATLTSNNATNLGGQAASYYRNADNINAGTLASARISGNYTGITNVGTLGVLNVTGNATINNFSITSSPNVVTIATSNVNIDSGVLFIDAINNRVGISNTSPDTQLTVTGSANISGDLRVLGDFYIEGSTVTSGTTEYTGALTPSANGVLLGNVTNRWNLTANVANFSGNVTFGANLIINTTSISYVGNSTTSPTVTVANTGAITVGNSTTTQTVSGLTVANSTGSASITPAGFTGNGINITSLNATSIDNGTLPNARLASAVVNTSGNFSLSGNNTLAGSNTTISSNLNVTGTFINVASAFIANALGAYHTGTINAASHTVGTVVVANATTLNVNGAVVNSTGGFFGALVNATAFTTTGNANAVNFNSGANLTVNSSAVTWTGNSTTSPTITLANTGAFRIGNSTTTQTASIITVANSAGNVQITPAGITGNGINITSLNATSIDNGTLPNARLTSAVVNTSGNFTISGNTTLAGTNTTVTSNLNVTGTFLNVASAFIANSTGAYHTGTVNAASHTVGSNFIANSLGVYHTGIVNAASHTVGANLVVNSTSIAYVGNSTTSPTVTLANTGAFTIGNSTTTQTTSIISVANSVGSANITPAGFFGNGFNLTSLNATSITNGTIPELRLPFGNATNRGALIVLDSVTNTSIIDYAASANSVKNAYDRAIDANTRAASAQSAAVSAYTNATTFASNATNLTTGTVASARISGAYTGITQVGTLGGLAVTGNSNFDSGVLFVDGTNNRVGVNTTTPSVSLQIAANDAIFVPLGNTVQRPTGANGMFRYNTDTSNFEGYANGAWGTVAGTGAGGYYKGNFGAVGNTDNKANLYKINSNTQSNNITITAGENALTVGPMTIQVGFNLTIEEGGRAVII